MDMSGVDSPIYRRTYPPFCAVLCDSAVRRSWHVLSWKLR
jgi:hypothetical protein